MSTTSDSFIPGLALIQLTPDEEDDYLSDHIDNEETFTTWLDDSECQENLFQIIPLTPDETFVDENNHIQPCVKLFFEELGYLTEEPEPIDPDFDYEEEARQMLEERNRTRQKHINISRTPSLAHSRSGVSSSSSSICHHEYDVRSPHFMGGGYGDQFSPPHFTPYLHASYQDKPSHQPLHPNAVYHINRIRHF